MPHTYADTLTVTLTVEQWSRISTAMTDSRRYNQHHKWYGLAELTAETADALDAQIGKALDEAAEHLDAEMAKDKARPSSFHFTSDEARALCADNRDYQMIGAGRDWFKIWCGTSAHYVER